MRLPRWRHPILDLAPAVVLTAFFTLGGGLLPFVGGPVIDFPGVNDLTFALINAFLWAALAVLGVLLYALVRLLWRRRLGQATAIDTVRGLSVTLERVLPGVLVVFGGMFLIRLLMPTFLQLKAAIPLLRPYGELDLSLAALDRAIHFGVDPWRLLQPVLGQPWVTSAVDAIYFGWYTVTLVGFVALTFWLRGAERGRFLLAFSSTWIFLGLLLATAMSSVGPCFVDLLLGGPSSFTPLMDYLARVNQTRPLQALDLQRQLWTAYVTGEGGVVSGISAMPSLHVAIPALFAVATWERARRVALALWAYTAAIVIGSVHLGWHYALDGYASILLVPFIWWSTGLVSRWWYARTRGWRWGWRAELRARPSGARL